MMGELKIGKLLLIIMILGSSALMSLRISDSHHEMIFPEIDHSEGNELTKKRVELGRRLFYDPVLSLDSTVSCASCHIQEHAFADIQPISAGVQGRLATRNAPTLTNIGYNPTLLFDGFLPSLEQQVLVPIEEHNEMDFNIVLAVERLKKNKKYIKLARKAYDRELDPWTITRSISLFQRTLVSNSSKFDKMLAGKTALTKSEENGRDLFFNQLHCTTCHSGFNFTTFEVANNGLEVKYADVGRMRVTKKEEDKAMFKIPTLRNIELTGPYMHDGRISTLEDVIRHYESGGKDHPNKHESIRPFSLTDQERNDLISFLKTLTDWEFISDKKIGPPR